MASTIIPACSFTCATRAKKQSVLAKSSLSEDDGVRLVDSDMASLVSRRSALVTGLSTACGVALALPGDGDAMAATQALLAGRIPGLSEPDENENLPATPLSKPLDGESGQHLAVTRSHPRGLARMLHTGWRTYRRPDAKSGGHGVGWSPIIPYSFSVPPEWDEVPVSIADLGGTEIDLRFANPKEGRLYVIVAPVLRFADLGGNATIEAIGTPDKVINAFGPEIIGENVEGKVLKTEVAEHSGRTYYQFELEPPHALITATAAGNRLYLFNVTASGLQWKRHNTSLKRIADSFRVA